MNEFLIRSEKIYTSDGKIDGALLIKGSSIEKIIKKTELVKYSNIPLIDAKNYTVIPGLIDIHIHGSGGWSIGTGCIEDVKGLCRYLPSVGVTGFQPTLGGEDKKMIIKSLKTIATVIDEGYKGAKILGIHMEGPFVNPEKNGIFLIENLLQPSISLMKSFIEASNQNIRHVTIAPELNGSENVIDFLVKNNILVAGGHTNATISETNKAIKAGVRLSNHTCNAQRSIHHREPGALGAYLLSDKVYCELICDFFHVHPEMIKLILKAKSYDKICMVSDAIIASGLRPGKYQFSGRDVIIDDGWSKLSDGTIAGSTKNLLYGFKNMITKLGLPIEKVIKMTSYIPAKLAGVDKKKGTIKEGKDADMVILDESFDVKTTIVEGDILFDSINNENFINNSIYSSYKNQI